MSDTEQTPLFTDGGTRTVVLAGDPLAVSQEHLRGRTLLTPNERAARALRGAGGSVSLATRATRALRSQGLHVAGALSRLIALREVVAKELGASDARGMARRLEPVVSEMLRAGLASRPGLAAALDHATEVGRRSVEVGELALAYSSALAELDEVDPAELLWRGADAVSEPEPVLVAGYARLGAGEVAVVDAMAAAGSVVVLPAGFRASEDVAEALVARGWVVERSGVLGEGVGPRLAAAFTAAVGVVPGSSGEGVGATDEEPALVARRVADEGAEVRWVLARVKGLLAGGSRPDDLALVARDERGYGPLVRAVAAEFEVPLRLGYSVPLRETRLGEVVAGLVAAVGKYLQFEETLRLLRHPLTRALSQETLAVALERHPAGPQEWVKAGVDVAELLAWPPKASWDEYKDHLHASLEGLGVDRLAEGRDRRAQVRMFKALDDGTPRKGSKRAAERVGLADFLGRLSDVLETAGMPADPPGKGAVELHSPLAVFGARYRHVFVLGLTEGTFPQPVAEDPVVDFRERRSLSEVGLDLEGAEGASEREELSFLAVLHAAGDSVTLTVPEQQYGTERLPSPYLAAVGAVTLPAAAPRAPASDLERLMIALPTSEGPARRAWDVERRREGGDPPDAFDGLVGVPVDAKGPFSASQLASFGQCGFKWFAQYGLRLSEVTEAEEDVSPLTAGSVFHDTLRLALEWASNEVERAGQPSEDGTVEPFRAAVLRHLEKSYDRAHKDREERGELIRSQTWPLQKRENLEKLTRLVLSPDFILPGARVAHLEVGFTGRWRGLDVRGYVDRIDIVDTADGEALVFTDYKLGKSPPKGAKGEKGTLNLDVQLPLYIEAAAPKLHPGMKVLAARYLSINGAEVSKAVDPADIDGAALDGLVARFRDALASGEFPLDPDVRQQACEYCPFDLVCRRGPRLSRKSAARESEAEEREAAA